MHKVYELKEKLCEQLEEYAGKDLTPTSLEIIDKLTHTIKNINKILDKYEGNEYSGAYGGEYYDNSYNMYDVRGRIVPRGGSYAMGRGSGRGGSGRGYSRNGYSRSGDVLMELNELMDDAPDERTRMEIQKCIQKIQTM